MRRGSVVAGTVVAGVLVAACTGGGASATPADAGPGPHAAASAGAAPVVIRVAQAGAVVGQALRAYVMAPKPLKGTTFELVDPHGRVVEGWSLGASAGSWNAAYGSVQPIDLGRVSEPGTYHVRLVGGSTVTSPAIPVGRRAAVSKALTHASTSFLTVQRDGADTVAGRLHRRPSHLLDRTAVVYHPPTFTDPDSDELAAALRPLKGAPTRNVSGGWFDAGDYLKFTQTASYSLDTTLVALRESRAGGGALDAETAHGLSWLRKMWDGKTGVLYAQVGIGSGSDDLGIWGDHDVWRLPQADDAAHPAKGSQTYFISHRPVFAANAAGRPISPNLAGRVAAAFAVAAQVERHHHRALARRDLARARAVLKHAKTTHVHSLVTVYPNSYYPESSWTDDLELGSVEVARAARLLHASHSARSLSPAVRWATRTLASSDRDSLNLYDASALAEAELATELAHRHHHPVLRRRLVADLRHQLVVAQKRAAKDPFGSAAIVTDYDSVSHELGLVATAAMYKRVTGSSAFDGFAHRQRDWVFGANAWGTSFVIGEGSTFPDCPQHQVANLSGSLTGGRDVVVGGIVNGPNGSDQFTDLGVPDGAKACPPAGGDAFAPFDTKAATYLDDVQAWPSVEPADDFTATGILAFAIG